MQAFTKQFVSFVDASPTPFHVCKSASKLLEEAGFVRIYENTSWLSNLNVKGGKYYFLRNDTSLVAFSIGYGQNWNGSYCPPFKIIGAHTDSPVLKVKPNSKITAYGFEQVGVECYGGGLWETWFDRDLGIAGKVIVRSGENKLDSHLVHINEPILRIPTLCIHLRTEQERKAFAFNKETHLLPILSMASQELNSSKFSDSNPDSSSSSEKHHIKLLEILAKNIGCQPKDILDFDLSLCDTHKPTIGGANKEFIFSPRLDNQIHCFTSLQALIKSSTEENLSRNTGVNMCILFDHEEVGSNSNEGAKSPLLRDSIHRIVSCISETSRTETSPPFLLDENVNITLSKSILLSADSAHAVHPSYASKHEKNHQCQMEKGTVIKTNKNQCYATNLVTGFLLREICRTSKMKFDNNCEDVNIPFQEFVVRNDSRCGSTIGPHSASTVGIRTVDVGVPQLSMHSIRETASVKDIWSNFHLFNFFYEKADEIDSKLSKV